MGYPSFANPKFPIDYIVGDYYENDATPVALTGGQTVTITGSLPAGLTYDSGDNKIKGVATTVADTDITVKIYNGPTLISAYPYTIVVLELDITFDGGSSFATYTTRTDTFGYSITGSYTADSTSFSDPSSESVLPVGLILTLGSTAGFTGFAKETGNFKAVLTVSDAASHSFKKTITFATTAGTPSGTQLPTLLGINTVAQTKSVGFSQTYAAINGNSNYNYYTDLAGRGNTLTGTFSVHTAGGGTYKIACADQMYQTNDLSIAGETVQLVSSSVSSNGIDPANMFIWFTTYDGGTYRLYKYDVVNRTKAASITSSFAMVALCEVQNYISAADKTKIYVITAPESANDFVIHEVSVSTLSETNTKTFSAQSAVTINGFVRSGTTGKMIILTNNNGDSGANSDAPQYYDPAGNTLTPMTLTAAKNYISACYGTITGTEYAYLLNQTDGSVIRYKLSDDTSITTSIDGVLWNGTCSTDKIIHYLSDAENTDYLIITDSGRDVVYRSTLSIGTIPIWKTLSAGAKPTNLYSDGRLVYVYQQGFNNVVTLYSTTPTSGNTVTLNRGNNRIAMVSAPQGSPVTYNAIGPIKPGTVSIEFSTTDLGKLTSTDSSGVITGVGGASNGTINYCTGEIIFNYPTTTTGTPYLSYVNTPTVFTGFTNPNTFKTYCFNNLELCEISNNTNVISTTLLADNKEAINRTSTTTISTNTVTPISENVTITWTDLKRAPYSNTIYGSLPPGISLVWPNSDDSHFALTGTCSTPGVYIFTVSVGAHDFS